MPEHALHLSGVDHITYGELHLEQQGPLVAAMSVGADRASPSLEFKGEAPNEDALSGRDDGRFARLVVADSHFGSQASHELVAAIHRAPYDVATPPVVLPQPAVDGSETTLTTVWLDRFRGVAHVQWFGDSLAIVLRADQLPLVLVEADDEFITPQAFGWTEARSVAVQVQAGDVLLAFSDGVNECHYRRPQTSVNLHHVQALFDEAAGLVDFVEELGRLALRGVDEHPGGQDNIAIVAVQV